MTESLETRSRTFDAENPEVYAKLLDLARTIKARGMGRVSIALLFERLRWISQIETTGDQFKLNNSYRAYYARKLMREPGLDGLFETRGDDIADPRGQGLLAFE